MRRVAKWWIDSMTAFDVFINVFLLFGLPDETISAHAGRAMLEGKVWGKAVSYALEYCPLFGRKHVQGAIAHDAARARAVVAAELAAQALETGNDQKIT